MISAPLTHGFEVGLSSAHWQIKEREHSEGVLTLNCLGPQVTSTYVPMPRTSHMAPSKCKGSGKWGSLMGPGRENSSDDHPANLGLGYRGSRLPWGLCQRKVWRLRTVSGPPGHTINVSCDYYWSWRGEWKRLFSFWVVEPYSCHLRAACNYGSYWVTKASVRKKCWHIEREAQVKDRGQRVILTVRKCLLQSRLSSILGWSAINNNNSSYQLLMPYYVPDALLSS